MEKFGSQILKFRWVTIIIVLIVTLFLGYQLPKIKINSDVISSLPDDDRDAVLLKKIGAQFGGNRLGMIILESEDIFTPGVIEHVSLLTSAIAEIEGVSSVTSLSNIMDIKEGEFGMEIGKLVDEYNLPQTQQEFAELKEKVLAKEMYRGVIVSEDATATIVIFTLYDDADIQAMAHAVIEKTEELNLPEQIHYAGSPMMITSIAHLISADLFKLLPIAFLLIVLVLFLGFHTVRGVLLPILVAVISIIWVIGIMAITGSEMSMVSNNIPIVLLAIGTAYSIHVLNRIDKMRHKLDKAIVMALKSVIIPVILAALTTITGFASFIFGSYLTMIRDFGLFTALGTLFAMILSLFFVPAIISAFKWETKRKINDPDGTKKSYLSDYILNPLQNVLYHHTNRILVSWIVLIIIGIGGIFLIKRNVDIRNYFKQGNPTRVAEDIMTSKFGGTKPVFVLFKGDVQSPELLNLMLKTEEHMKANPGVEATQSVANLIVEVNGALGEGRNIPDEKDKIEQLWFLLDGNENMQKYVSPDLDEAIIISKFSPSDNEAKIEFISDMREFIQENSTEECTIEITGMPFIDVTMDKSLIKSQLGSLAIALLFVLVIVGAILRSFAAGIYATIPIVATIIFLFGVMGFTGIPLNIATVLVASIAMGIGIDYSIHVITHFNDAIEKGATINQALKETIGISGKAIIINVTSVSAGFLVLLFSEMVPLQYFGMLICLSMIGSGLSSLTLLPLILLRTHRKQALKKDA